MYASRRRTEIDENWFRGRIERVSGTREYQRRLRSITALQAGDWKGEDYSRELTVYACLAVSPHQGRPEALERAWASKTGKTWKALREFPQQLIRMADEVERITVGDPAFFARTPHWNVDRRESLKLKEDCEKLPDLMRSYAKALRERNAFVVRATPRSGSLKALLELSEIVKLLTGHYHDRQVAELLNAAADVFGGVVQFDALGVAQARSRHRKRSVQT